MFPQCFQYFFRFWHGDVNTNGAPVIQGDVGHVNYYSREDEKQSLKEWLSPFNFLNQHDQLLANCCQDVGTWFLHSQEFNYWIASSHCHLRCWAPAGSGKTYLSAIVVNFLKQEFEPSKVPVLCLYLDQTDSEKYDLKNLVGNLLWQLIRFKGFNPKSETSKRLLSDIKDDKNPQLPQITEAFKVELESVKRLFIVVDGLDHCPSRHKLENELIQWKSSGKLSLMLTARYPERGSIEIRCGTCQEFVKVYYNCRLCDLGDFDLCQRCKDSGLTCRDESHEPLQGPEDIELDVHAPLSDIRLYLYWKINNERAECAPQRRDERIHPRPLRVSHFANQLRGDAQLAERIVSVVSRKAESSFLVAELNMECLKQEMNTNDIYSALATHPDTLFHSYTQSLQQIADDIKSHRNLAHKTLSRVVCARRDLTFIELQHVLAVTPENPRISSASLYNQNDILGTTRGLVTIMVFQDAVKLCHDTLRTHLECHESFKDADLEMAQACLIYLRCEGFSEACLEVEEIYVKSKERPFIAYASQHWGDHVRDALQTCDNCGDLEDIAFQYITDPNLVAACVQAAWVTAKTPFNRWDVRQGINGLHLCAYFGLLPLILRLLQDKAQVHAQDGKHKYTPPLVTPEGTLDIDVPERTYGQTPLMYACRKGHGEVARMFLDHGASINIVSELGRTALFEAIIAGHECTVGVLIDYDLEKKVLDINARQTHQSDRTALMLAIQHRSSATVNHLLRHPGVDINLQDADGRTALSLAAEQNFQAAVHTLLERREIKIDLVAKTTGRSALMYAAGHDLADLFEVLLNRGANSALKDLEGNTALMLAAKFGSISVLKVLLQKKGDLHHTDNSGRGVIHRASVSGHAQIIHNLHQHKLDLNLQDHEGGTPLHDAGRHGQEEVVQTLLKYGANVSIRDNLDRTPAAVAYEYGYQGVLDLLQGASNGTETQTITKINAEHLPIWSLARLGDLESISKMIDSRPHEVSNLKPDTNDTALHCSIPAGRIDALKKLLDSGCISPDSLNRYQRTPLHIAAMLGNQGATALLINRHAQLNVKDKWGSTPLSLSINRSEADKHFPVAISLIAAGAHVEPKLVSHLFLEAVECENIKAVHSLIKQGADLLSRNIQGMTAFQIAKQKGNAEMIRTVANCPSFHFQPGTRRGLPNLAL